MVDQPIIGSGEPHQGAHGHSLEKPLEITELLTFYHLIIYKP